MKILHLAWEYPPYKVGGLATHVEELAHAQAKMGYEPIVITCAFEGKEGYENVDGVHVFRFNADNIPAEDFPSWALQMNLLMQNEASQVISEFKDISLFHTHDWLSATSAIALKHIYRLPLISTVHSLEVGRRGGIYDDRQKMINDIEGRMVYESWKVLTCSEFMKRSVSSQFSVPWDKIDVVPNGVNAAKFKTPENLLAEKNRFALPHEKIVFFVGRHVWEKGVDVLVGAIPYVLKECPDAKFVISGKGYMTDKCKKLAWDFGVADKTLFTEYVDDNTLNLLYHLSDVVVCPSRYEPFGIVPLEAMASNAPVVISDTGGLNEIIEHEKDGLKVMTNNSESLAWGITRVLKDPGLAQFMKKNAAEKVRSIYDWEKIAARTCNIYNQVISDYQKNSWKPRGPQAKV
ncbi:D-inositol-3-phosphate glycosyltransferase [uncultured archaeon]|nr:D-inositol-3-phosphate glycosyltransferase [uncultured archaeon]